MKNDYAYIVAGGGAAGLSLVYRLLGAGITDRPILLVDRERKTTNDRTWSFWEAGTGTFEAQLYDQWDHLWFHSPTHSQCLDIAPFRYKTLRGIDFYRTTNARIDAATNVTRVYGEVERLENTPNGVALWLEGTAYTGDFAFSSIPAAPLDRTRPNYLDQHFKGWVIATERPVFDPERATLMDFRLPQCGETRFVYVLPYSPTRAMIEFTIFGKQLLPDAEYDQHLRHYIDRFITTGGYTVQHEEFGIIPMTDQPLPTREGRIHYLGTAGGNVKTSTGYAFQRIQAVTTAFTRRILHTGSPEGTHLPGEARYRLFDSTLLNVLVNRRLDADALFTDLFKNNPPERLLRFLGEESTLLDELSVMASVPTLPFLRAFMAECRARWLPPSSPAASLLATGNRET